MLNMRICALLFLSTTLWANSLQTIALDTMVELKWSVPADVDHLVGFMIRRSTTDFPSSSSKGDLVYLGKSIHLLNVNCDRGLINDTEYFYTLFTIDHQGHILPWLKQKATPKKQQPSTNYIFNGDFSADFDGWEKEAGHATIIPTEGLKQKNCVLLSTREKEKATLSQNTEKILKPKTLYTCAYAVYDRSGAHSVVYLVEFKMNSRPHRAAPKSMNWVTLKIPAETRSRNFGKSAVLYFGQEKKRTPDILSTDRSL